jgi:sulfite reductase (NADPH) flavoprotein alpha-component
VQTVPFIPENAPFSVRQRLWLNGYLAGLFSGSSQPAPGDSEHKTNRSSVPLLILFGSQTGTAERIARNLAKESKNHGCTARVLEASAYATVNWKVEKNLLVVTSTYGDGDMPDNGQAFWDWLQTENANALLHLNFSVLALGDSNYEQFCAAGKKIDGRLEQIGAKRIHPRTDCDLDYEAAAKAWAEGILQKLAQDADVSSESSRQPESKEGQGSKPAETSSLLYNKNNPFLARLIANRRLSGNGSEKETRHYEIALDDSGLTYEAGDALGVFPVNCPELVSELLGVLGFDGEEAVPTPLGELPVRKALGSVFDITKPGTELLQRIAVHNSGLRELLPPERKEDLKRWLWGRGVWDLLVATPKARFSPAEFVALLKKLTPRLYSIASSPKAHPGQVHLTINTVRYEAFGRSRKGVGSTFLADRVGEAERVRIFVQPSHGFRPPENPDSPMIMVGPGTGVAPFRSFLHERRAMAARGRHWLFFGEQRAATDFYYREELEQMLSEGHLTRLATAFSRDQGEKIYVQHRMLEHAAELWSWLQEDAHFYVCGDATRMAKDVDAALHRIAATAGGLGEDGAQEFVRKLRAEKRYQRDVY